MAEEQFTVFDKARLLATVDSKRMDDYDEKFYELLKKPDMPNMEDLDGRIRRAIYKFVSGYYENVMISLAEDASPDENDIRSGLTILLLRGYELGRKLRRPLTTKPVHQ